MTDEDRKLCKETIEKWIEYWMEFKGLSRQECIDIFRKELFKDR